MRGAVMESELGNRVTSAAGADRPRDPMPAAQSDWAGAAGLNVTRKYLADRGERTVRSGRLRSELEIGHGESSVLARLSPGSGARAEPPSAGSVWVPRHEATARIVCG